ncbi:hypothetical protein KSP39_PZI016300 [Platanthera zijinensis]|uniref:Uncharacterized protein n=1 Tax=Platanthera zijinensis TaxID=2320716 RepID=A0AAP0B6X2_9ASPA
MGRSSFRSIRQKMEMEGVEMDRLSVFKRTRTDKRGMIEFESQDIIDEVNSLYEKLPEEERTAEYKEACFVKVMGEDGHGRVRTWGSGVSKPLSEEASKSIRTQIREEAFLCLSPVASKILPASSYTSQRTRLMRQIEQHNEKRATFADQKRENDDYSYDISLNEDFVTALEYGMPPASGMSIPLPRCWVFLPRIAEHLAPCYWVFFPGIEEHLTPTLLSVSPRIVEHLDPTLAGVPPPPPPPHCRASPTHVARLFSPTLQSISLPRCWAFRPCVVEKFAPMSQGISPPGYIGS